MGLCYTCELAQEYIQRTPTPPSPILCSWSTPEFLSGLDENLKLDKYQDLTDFIKYLFKAIDRDTKSYHKWLVPKLNQLMQMSPRKSHRLPGFTYCDHEELNLNFEERLRKYFERINNCTPRIIMVELPKNKCKKPKPKQISVENETWRLKTVAIYENNNNWMCGVVLMLEEFVILDCYPEVIKNKVQRRSEIKELANEVHAIYIEYQLTTSRRSHTAVVGVSFIRKCQLR